METEEYIDLTYSMCRVSSSLFHVSCCKSCINVWSLGIFRMRENYSISAEFYVSLIVTEQLLFEN